MAVKLGLTDIADAKLGTTQVDKIYLGSTEVWSNAPAPTIKALKFSSTGAQTLSVNNSYIKTLTPYFEYSLDDGTTWTAWEPRRNAITPISFGNGIDLYLRGTNTTFATGGSTYIGFVFSTESSVSCTGNIMHLLDFTQDLTTFPTGSTLTFKSLFSNCPVLTSAPDLPATTLVENCYRNMFYGCSGLTSAPALPATALASECYENMFYGSGMVNAPELPATNLAYMCYAGMFQNCSSLISAPALPATTLAERCYGSMFQNCTSLTQIPSLSHIDTVQSGSIRYMFYGCTGIKMSTTQDAEYASTYTFGVTPTTTLAEEMFTNTGGTFTGTPTAQTYYTANTIVS